MLMWEGQSFDNETLEVKKAACRWSLFFLSFFFFFLEHFIMRDNPYIYIIHDFKVYNLMPFSIFTIVQLPSQSILEHCHLPPKKNPSIYLIYHLISSTFTQQRQPLICFLTLLIYLVGAFHMELYNM